MKDEIEDKEAQDIMNEFKNELETVSSDMKRIIRKRAFMQAIKTFVQKYSVAIIILAGIVFSFYWLQIRPGQIRSFCANEATSKTYYRVATNNYYRNCLATHGLEPESLFVGR